MNKKDLQKCKDKLVQMHASIKSRLFGDGAFSMNTKDASDNVPIVSSHMGDVGTEVFDCDLQFNIASGESDLLTAVQEALGKIEEGTYGICQMCQTKINEQRLLAIPYVLNCVPCQEKVERRQDL